jgi:hypothetical protein
MHLSEGGWNVFSQSLRSLLLYHGPDILLRDPLEDAGRPMVEDLSSLKLSSDTTLPLQEISAYKAATAQASTS